MALHLTASLLPDLLHRLPLGTPWSRTNLCPKCHSPSTCLFHRGEGLWGTQLA